MKLDKETLIKQRFWILVGTVVPLVLVVLILLSTVVSRSIGKEREAYEKSKKELTSVTSAKNQTFVDKLEDKRKKLAGKKDEVWKEAWLTQDGLMSWPRFDTESLNRQLATAHFGDELPDRERRTYTDTFYRQFLRDTFEGFLTPVEYSGGWQNLLRYVGQNQTEFAKWKQPATTEECWLAQEDIWVQRELLQIIKSALDSVGRFHPVEGAAKNPVPQGALGQWRLRNANWEINLVFRNNDQNQLTVAADSTIKNVNAGKRTLLLGRGKQPGVRLRLRQPGDATAEVLVEGTPLPYDKQEPFNKATRVSGIDPKQPVEVEQVFDWYTSPIKRVDHIAMGHQAHRLADYALVPTKFSAKFIEEAGAAAGAAGAASDQGGGGKGSGGMPGMGPPAGMPGMPGMGGPRGDTGSPDGGLGAMGGSTNPVDGTPNGLARKRYLEVTDQVRRMPIGMVVVVDQAFMQDLRTAFVNSRLRIQPTQDHWQHVRGIRPTETPESSTEGTAVAGGAPSSETGSPDGGPGVPRPGMATPRPGTALPGLGPRGGGLAGPAANPGLTGGGPRPGMASPRPGMANPGVAGGMSPRPGGVTPGLAATGGPRGGQPGFFGDSGDFSSADEDDPNLVELALYGIASLYERYPPKPKDGATAEAPK